MAATDRKEFMPSTGNLIKSLCPRRSQGLRGNLVWLSCYGDVKLLHILVIPTD